MLDLALARGLPLPTLPLEQAGSTPQLLSPRVRCRTFLPMFGGIANIASLCVR